MENFWIKKANKRQGIKGEHSYLEAIEDVKSLITSRLRKINKDNPDVANALEYITKDLNNYAKK